MTRRGSDSYDDDREQAARFVVEGEEPHRDELQLVTWLSASRGHVAEYMRMAALWEALADPRLEIATPPAARPFLRRASWFAAAAALLLCLAAAGWWAATRPRTYQTAVGEVRSFSLSDRSVVFLDADSRMSVSYSDTQRRIVLQSGEVLFEVAPDVERPFVVICGTMRVTAVGTKFVVGRRPNKTTVTLIEGKIVVAGPVSIAPATAAPVSPPRLGERETITLAPRQRLTISESGRATIETVDSQQVAAWRERRLAFDSEPLAEVAAEFNRFNTPPIRIEGDTLRAMRISGVFAANDPESLLAYLRSLDGIEVRMEEDGGATVRSSR